jgi:hypothetical protein
VFHLKPPRLHGEIKIGFCFAQFLVDQMHNLTEDIGNEILVNQYILCACYHVQVRLTNYHVQVHLTCYHVQVHLTCYHVQVRLTCYHVQVRLACYHVQLRLTCYHVHVRLTQNVAFDSLNNASNVLPQCI